MKTVKNLLVPFIVLVALVIAAAVYFIVDSQKHKAVIESASGMIEVVYINSSDILNLTVDNNTTGYTSRIDCAHQSNGEISFALIADDIDPECVYSQSEMGQFVSSFSSIQCRSKVSDQGNFTDYGLDTPSFTVTINTTAGSSTRYFFGNVSPDPNYCYLSVDGSKDIYLVSVEKLHLAGSTSVNFLDDKVLQIDYNELDTVTFKRASDKLSMEIKVSIDSSDDPVFEIVNPYSHSISSYFSTLIKNVCNLYISDFVDIPSSEKADYGLSDPEYHFIFMMKNGNSTELYLSSQISGCYYGYIKGQDYCFKLSGSQFIGLDFSETKLIYPYIMDIVPSELSSLNCVYGNESFKLDFNVPAGQTISSSEADIKLDGRNSKVSDSTGRSYLSVLLESLNSIEIAGIIMNADVDTSSGPVFSISYISGDYTTTVYDFYTRDNNSFFIFKNGKFTNFYVFSEEIFKNSGSDTYNYGCWAAYKLLDEAIKGAINGVYDIPWNGQNDGN